MKYTTMLTKAVTEKDTRDIIMRRCSLCGEEKTLEFFFKSKKGQYGRQSRCKTCSNKLGAAYRLKNRDKLKLYNEARQAKSKAWRTANKDILKIKRRERYLANRPMVLEKAKAYREKNRESIRAKNLVYNREYRASHREQISAQGKEYYQENKEILNSKCRDSYRKHPQRERAKGAVMIAMRAGKLKRPGKCSKCNRDCIPDGHHWSYLEEHFLDIEWLCRSCHKQLHAEINRAKQSLAKRKELSNG